MASDLTPYKWKGKQNVDKRVEIYNSTIFASKFYNLQCGLSHGIICLASHNGLDQMTIGLHSHPKSNQWFLHLLKHNPTPS